MLRSVLFSVMSSGVGGGGFVRVIDGFASDRLGHKLSGFEPVGISLSGKITGIGDYAITTGKNMVSADIRINGNKLQFNKNGNLGFYGDNNIITHAIGEDGNYAGSTSTHEGNTLDGFVIKSTFHKLHFGSNDGLLFGAGMMGNIEDFVSRFTFIPGATLSILGDSKFGTWLRAGNFNFSASSFSAKKELLQEAAWTGKYIKNAGNLLGVVGMVFTVSNMIINGRNTSNTLDFAMGAIGFQCPVAGLIYFPTNEIIKAQSGKTIGENLDEMYKYQQWAWWFSHRYH